jgi:hypothetical protein
MSNTGFEIQGMSILVAREGEEITGPNGDRLVVSRGSAVCNHDTIWMVKADFDALKAAVPTPDALKGDAKP